MFQKSKFFVYSNFIIKITQKNNKKSLKEINFYKSLNKNFYFPKFISSFSNQKFNFLILENTGKNLISTYKNFSLLDFNNLYSKILKAIDYLHDLGFLHRDIKPENITVKNKDFYLIDFDLVEKIEDVKTNFIGNIKFCSLRVLKNIKLNHFDLKEIKNNDYISLCYSVLYLYDRNLPWKSDMDKLQNVDKFINLIQNTKTKDNFVLFLFNELKKYKEI